MSDLITVSVKEYYHDCHKIRFRRFSKHFFKNQLQVRAFLSKYPVRPDYVYFFRLVFIDVPELFYMIDENGVLREIAGAVYEN